MSFRIGSASPPRTGRPATPKEMIWIGALFAAAGFYFMLVGAGLLPIPGGPSGLHAPLWVVLVTGLPFFLGGVAVFVQGIGKAKPNGELPPTAPQWMRVVQQMCVLVIFAAFAVLASWISLAGESGQFSGPGGVGVARVAFGIGALICWACTIGMAVAMARKLIGARKPS